jgi:hypothetical protein
MLKRWDGFISFLDDDRICLTNNAAERALRGFALGRKSWLFAGSDRGADRAAFMATLIVTAKLNNVDPQAWLADVLARIADTPVTKLEQLLPWSWQPSFPRQEQTVEPATFSGELLWNSPPIPKSTSTKHFAYPCGRGADPRRRHAKTQRLSMPPTTDTSTMP